MLTINQKLFPLFFAALKHAYLTNKLTFVYPYYSNFICNFLNILVKEGLIAGWSFTSLRTGLKGIRVSLRYLKTGVPVVFKLSLCSTPGRKRFLNSYELSAYLNLNQSDVLILSTSRGLLTGSQAQFAGVGGELLCVFR